MRFEACSSTTVEPSRPGAVTFAETHTNWAPSPAGDGARRRTGQRVTGDRAGRSDHRPRCIPPMWELARQTVSPSAAPEVAGAQAVEQDRDTQHGALDDLLVIRADVQGEQA